VAICLGMTMALVVVLVLVEAQQRPW
jgi:hypothetical protein